MSLAGVADTTCWVIEVGLNGALTRCYKSMFFFFLWKVSANLSSIAVVLGEELLILVCTKLCQHVHSDCNVFT